MYLTVTVNVNVFVIFKLLFTIIENVTGISRICTVLQTTFFIFKKLTFGGSWQTQTLEKIVTGHQSTTISGSLPKRNRV